MCKLASAVRVSVLTLTLAARAAPAADQATALSAGDWRDDLAYLVATLEAVHPALYGRVGPRARQCRRTRRLRGAAPGGLCDVEWWAPFSLPELNHLGHELLDADRYEDALAAPTHRPHSSSGSARSRIRRQVTGRPHLLAAAGSQSLCYNVAHAEDRNPRSEAERLSCGRRSGRRRDGDNHPTGAPCCPDGAAGGEPDGSSDHRGSNSAGTAISGRSPCTAEATAGRHVDLGGPGRDAALRALLGCSTSIPRQPRSSSSPKNAPRRCAGGSRSGAIGSCRAISCEPSFFGRRGELRLITWCRRGLFSSPCR